MRTWIATAAVAVVVTAGSVSAQPVRGSFTVASPGGDIVVTVTAGPQVQWAVSWRGTPLLEPSRIGLVLADGQTLGEAAVVVTTSARSADTVLKPVVSLTTSAVDAVDAAVAHVRPPA